VCRIEELDNHIAEELQTKLFLQIRPNRLKFFTDMERMYAAEMEQLDPLMGEEVHQCIASARRYPTFKMPGSIYLRLETVLPVGVSLPVFIIFRRLSSSDW
jgi:hypothetical protein